MRLDLPNTCSLTHIIVFYYNRIMFYILKVGQVYPTPPLCDLMDPSCSYSGLFCVSVC